MLDEGERRLALYTFVRSNNLLLPDTFSGDLMLIQPPIGTICFKELLTVGRDIAHRYGLSHVQRNSEDFRGYRHVFEELGYTYSRFWNEFRSK